MAEHVCGLSGFGEPGDICPACEENHKRWDAEAKQRQAVEAAHLIPSLSDADRKMVEQFLLVNSKVAIWLKDVHRAGKNEGLALGRHEWEQKIKEVFGLQS